MNSCEQYQELISRMVDGDINAEEERELTAHIQTCQECAALYSAFSMLSRWIGEELEEPPLDLRENVMAEIRREEIRKRNRLPTVLRAVLSAAACVAIIVGVYLGISLTRGDHLSVAAFQSGDVRQEEKASVTEEAAAEEDAALQMAAAAGLPAAAPELPPQENRLFAEEPAALPPTEDTEEAAPEMEPAGEVLDAIPAEEPAPEPDAAAEAAPAPKREAEEWELRGWNLSLLRSLLGARPADKSMEELEDCLLYRFRLTTEKESLEVLVYELDGVLYYVDPVEEVLYQAELTREELDQFLHS